MRTLTTPKTVITQLYTMKKPKGWTDFVLVVYPRKSSYDKECSQQSGGNVIILHPVLVLVNHVISPNLRNRSAIIDRLQEGFPWLDSVSRCGVLLHGCCALHILDKRGCVLVWHVDVDVGSCRGEGCMLRDNPEKCWVRFCSVCGFAVVVHEVESGASNDIGR